MERCPNCRARTDANAICRRCGMDLVTLIEVESAAERLTELGCAHLAAGDPMAAEQYLTGAANLRRAPFIELLLEFTGKLATEG